ncbi:MAG: tetratricopeptide repeat protein [Bacteroidota bacterium]
MKSQFLALLFFFLSCLVSAQSVDSLKIALQNAKDDTTRCSILNQLVDAESDDNIWPKYNEQLKQIVDKNLKTEQSSELKKFYLKYYAISLFNKGFIENMNGNVTQALTYFHKSLTIQELLKDYSGAANSTNNIGFIYMNMGNYDKALEHYKKSVTIQENINDEQGIANTYNNIGYIYKIQWNISQALHYYQKSLSIREKINDKKGQANSLNNIAVIYESQKETDKALEYYTKSLALREEMKDNKGIATLLNNLGGLSVQINKIDEALSYFERSLTIRNSINDQHGIAQSYSNIGGIYERKGDTKKAIEYYNKSLQIQEKIKDRKGASSSLNNIASALFIENNLPLAEKYALQSFEIANQIKFPEHIKSTSEILSKIYAKKGDYKSALQMQILFKQMDDSISNENNREIILKKGFQYAYDQKTAADSLKAAEHKKLIDAKLQQEKTQRYALYGGLSLVIFFAIFIYNRFKVTIKQKQIIEIQKQIVEAKNSEINQSIHYAERIQRALMASTELIDSRLAQNFIYLNPKEAVSGDFYWATNLSNGNFCLVAADSTGHGVPGAIMSILNIACLKEAITKGITSADLILNETRNLVIENLKNDGSAEGGKDGMDCSLLSFDLKNNKLEFALSNNPLWLFRNNELIEFNADKMPIGKHVKQNVPFNLQNISLQKGDTIYIFTDGYADQFGGEKGKKFMYKPLKELLLSLQNKAMAEQKQELEKHFLSWKGELEQVDDVCVIGVRV